MAKKDLKAAIAMGADRFFTAAQETQEVHEAHSTQEILQAQEERKTQGRKGMKLQRMNISLTPSEYEHLRLMAAITGQSATRYIGALIQKDAADKKELADKAKALLAEGGNAL